MYRIRKNSITLMPKRSTDGAFRLYRPITVQLPEEIIEALNNALRNKVYERLYFSSYPYDSSVDVEDLDNESFGWCVEEDVILTLDWCNKKPRLYFTLSIAYGEYYSEDEWDNDEWDSIRFDITKLLLCKDLKQAAVRYTITKR